MSETYSSSKRIPQHNSTSKIPFQLKKIEGIQKVKASNDIMKRLVESKRIDKIVKKNKELFDFQTLNNTIDSRINDDRCLSFKTIEKDSYKINDRNLSLNNDNKNNYYKDISRDESDCISVFNSSHLKKSTPTKPIRIQKVVPKIDFPLTKPLKLNLSLSKQKDRVKDTIIQEIKKMNSSLDASHKNGNTIINIHNNINIKIKDSKIPVHNNPLKATRNKNNESLITNTINGNDYSIKYSPNKTIHDKIKTNNYMTEQKSSSTKNSIVPSLKLNSKNLLASQIPLKLVNINPKVVKLSSLLKKKNNTNVSTSKIELNHNDNSIISFDESLISKRKKDSNPSQEKHEKNEEISLSYSEDEKANKPTKMKNNEKTVKKVLNSCEGEEEGSDNEKEFLKFCENLNKKILNK